MRQSLERDHKKEARELVNLVKTVKTGKTKDGLTFRPVELTEKKRTRGGAKSRRRTARVWKPRKLDLPD